MTGDTHVEPSGRVENTHPAPVDPCRHRLVGPGWAAAGDEQAYAIGRNSDCTVRYVDWTVYVRQSARSRPARTRTDAAVHSSEKLWRQSAR